MAGTGSSPDDRRAGSEPNLYAMIRDQLKDDIQAGRIHPGALLPSVRQITVKWTVSTTTARKALAELVSDGYARSEGTRGHVATGPKSAATASEESSEERRTMEPAQSAAGRLVARTLQTVPAAGAVTFTPTAVDVRVEPGPAEVALALRLDDSATPVIVRTRLTTDPHSTSLQLRTSYLLREAAENTPLAAPDAIDDPWPVALATHTGRSPVLAESYITARHPNDSEVTMLGLSLTACVLVRVDVTQGSDGVPIDYTVTIWPGESTHLSLETA